MSRRSNLLEFSVITLQTAGSILAVLAADVWIVVTVALSSQCMALIDYFYIPSQLAAINKSLENVHNFISLCAATCVWTHLPASVTIDCEVPRA